MDFHLPYLALRPWVSPKAQPTTNKNSSFRKWTDISFLGTKQSPLHRPNEALYEAQISLCVFGIDNRKWTAYCFVDTYFNNAETVKSSDEDSGYDSEDQDEDSYVYFSEDPIASEGEHSFGLDANLPIWDPREYYLTVIRLRVGRVLQEWRLIVLVVDRRVSVRERLCSHFHWQNC
jgi:hypothetical protein